MKIKIGIPDRGHHIEIGRSDYFEEYPYYVYLYGGHQADSNLSFADLTALRDALNEILKAGNPEMKQT